MFLPYLTGRHFNLRTDHGSLTWLRNFRNGPPLVLPLTDLVLTFLYRCIVAVVRVCHFSCVLYRNLPIHTYQYHSVTVLTTYLYHLVAVLV